MCVYKWYKERSKKKSLDITFACGVVILNCLWIQIVCFWKILNESPLPVYHHKLRTHVVKIDKKKSHIEVEVNKFVVDWGRNY